MVGLALILSYWRVPFRQDAARPGVLWPNLVFCGIIVLICLPLMASRRFGAFVMIGFGLFLLLGPVITPFGRAGGVPQYVGAGLVAYCVLRLLGLLGPPMIAKRNSAA